MRYCYKWAEKNIDSFELVVSSFNTHEGRPKPKDKHNRVCGIVCIVRTMSGEWKMRRKRLYLFAGKMKPTQWASAIHNTHTHTRMRLYIYLNEIVKFISHIFLSVL